MPGAGMFVTNTSQLGVSITHGFVALDHGMNCGFAFEIEFCEVFPNDSNFFVHAVGFGFVFRVLRSRTLTFADQPFGLYR